MKVLKSGNKKIFVVVSLGIIVIILLLLFVFHKETQFYLLGDEIVYILEGGKYQDEGYVATYGSQDYTNQVTIKNDVNYQEAGIYYIEYNLSSLEKKLVRQVQVINVDEYFDIDYDSSMTRELELDIKYNDNYLSYYVNPSNEKITLETSKYKVTKNGEYLFNVYDKYNNSSIKKIIINNIDDLKLSVTCEAKVSESKTEVTVNANRKVAKYVYNNISSSDSKYTFNSKVEDVTVLVYDEYDDYVSITCDKVSANMEVHFINSSQCDDAILIRTYDKTILIDSGSQYTKNAVLDYLNAIGVKKIDAMIGSHLHSDHIQTQGFVMESFQVDKIYYPDDIFTCVSRGSCVSGDRKYILDEINKQNKTPIVLKAGDKIEIGEITIYILAPWTVKTSSNSQNINSFVFILKFGDNTFMFTGDTETSILNNSKLKSYANELNIPLKVDVFKWPHHGTRSISNEFVNVISPKYVIVPNFNGYGKPTSSMTKGFRDIGASIYEQKDYGNVLFISDGTNINVVTKTNPSDYK